MIVSPNYDVGIRMLHRLQDFCHHHIAEMPGHRLYGINFQPGHGDLVRQLIGGERRVDPFTEPLFADFH